MVKRRKRLGIQKMPGWGEEPSVIVVQPQHSLGEVWIELSRSQLLPVLLL
jgi:hypothetical protein